ncbi:metallophosphoesterase family protein [Sporosarcina sp. Te-1]|uniref:metallophosphoesterase family protein n=1 Tax=Sporosarcina sp. Te-1 TaxID=2818390 RepID=UPI001FB0BBB2|nr:metallophosphoesterase family protein [Sporosarcina sp. Te-1]
MTLPISEDPFSRIVKPSLHNVASLFKESKEELICFGHHHPVHYFENDTTIYLNPGSLGCNSKTTAPYSVVEIHKSKIVISLKEAAYDNKEFLSSYERLQVPQRDFLLKIFHGNQLQ